MAITLDNIRKNYGRQKALDGIGFSLQTGEICGFLGPNGAGKSTTMKIITGFLTDYQGEVNISGINIRQQPIQAKALIGYLPEHNPLYPEMYIREYLLHVARLYRLPQPQKKVDEMIELTGLRPEIRKKIGQLSKGYRQRVGLAQALVHDPQVLILDEPMTGLDPNQLEEIRNLIVQTAKNKTVLLSTHIMQEVEAICDRVIIINQGKIVTDQPICDIQSFKSKGRTLRVEFAPDADTDWLAASDLFETIRPLSENSWLLTPRHAEDPRISLFYQAAYHQCPIIELKIEEHNLEEVFRKLTQSGIKN